MTAVRLLLVTAIVASAVVVFYGLILDHSPQANAFAVAGLFVLGVTLAVGAVLLAVGAVNAGRAGHAIRALLGAFVGGLFALASAGSLAGAVILGVLARPV